MIITVFNGIVAGKGVQRGEGRKGGKGKVIREGELRCLDLSGGATFKKLHVTASRDLCFLLFGTWEVD